MNRHCESSSKENIHLSEELMLEEGDGTLCGCAITHGHTQLRMPTDLRRTNGRTPHSADLGHILSPRDASTERQRLCHRWCPRRSESKKAMTEARTHPQPPSSDTYNNRVFQKVRVPKVLTVGLGSQILMYAIGSIAQ